MPRRRKRKTSNWWILPASVFILLAAFGLRHFLGRPRIHLEPMPEESQTLRSKPGDIPGLLETLRDKDYRIKALEPGEDGSYNFLVYVPQGYPLVQANLAVSKLVHSENFRPVKSLENRKRQRLDLIYLSKDSVILNITVLKRRTTTENSTRLPKIALVLYSWPPDKKDLFQQLDKLDIIKTIVVNVKYQSKSKEVFGTVILEPKGYPKIDPGPNTILVDDPTGRIRSKLDAAASQADEPAGLLISHGSRAVEDARIAEQVTAYCSRNQLILIEPHSSAQSLIKKYAQKYSCPYITPDLIIEPNTSLNACISMLKSQLAKNQGSAFILLPASENVSRALAKVITKQILENIEFMALSGMMQ
jgi:hypothetical protein